MDGLVKSLPLREEAKQALLGVANPAAHSLSLIRSFEAGDWGPCAGAAQEMGVTEDHLAGIYVTSLNWAAEALASSD
jgi:c-di-GMP-related signal transduction protein